MIQGERPTTPTLETQRQFDTWFQQEMIRQSLMASRSNDKCHDSPVNLNDPATVTKPSYFSIIYLLELETCSSNLL